MAGKKSSVSAVTESTTGTAVAEEDAPDATASKKAAEAKAKKRAEESAVKPEDSTEHVRRGWTGRQLFRLEESLRRRMFNLITAAERAGLLTRSKREENALGAVSVDVIVIDEQARELPLTLNKNGTPENAKIAQVIAIAAQHGLACKVEEKIGAITITVLDE